MFYTEEIRQKGIFSVQISLPKDEVVHPRGKGRYVQR